MPANQKELRCFCRREPLLATYGVDKQGNLFLHVRIYKQSRIYGEMFVTLGAAKIHCRECLRWHKVIIKDQNTAALEEVESPLHSNAIGDDGVLVAE